MAKTFGITFSIGASLGSTVRSAFASVQSKLKATQAAFQATNQKARQLQNVLEARRKLDAQTAKMRMEGGSQRDAALVGKLAEAYAKAAKQAGVYGQSIGQITRQLNEQARAAQASERRLNALNTIQRGRDMRQAASDTRKNAIAGAIADIGAGMALLRPLKIGAEFEASMSRVAAISGATGEQFDALRSQARELGASTVWSAKEAADGMAFLSMAGFKTHQTLAAMPGMLSLASAGAMDLASTADIASNVLSGFGLEAEKMKYVADIMAKTFTSSNTSIHSIGESMKYCAPAARAAGQSIEVVAAMVGKLGDAGIQGSMAGTALNAMMMRLASPPEMAATAMKQLGIEIKDAQGNMRGMPEILRELEVKTSKMGNVAKVGYFRRIFGLENAKSALILSQQALTGDLQKMIKGIYEDGFSDELAKKQTDNLLGDLKQLDSAAQEVGLCLYDVVSPALRQITQGIIPIVVSVGQWITANPRLCQGLALVAGGMLALKTAGLVFTVLNSYGKTLGGSLVSLRGHVQLCGNTIRTQLTRPVGNPFASAQAGAQRLRARLMSVRQGYQQLSMASMAAGAKAAASGAVAAAGRVGWNSLRLGVQGVGMAFKTAFGPVGLMMMALSYGSELIIEHWDKIQPYFESLWEGVKKIFTTVADWIKPIIDKISGFISPIISGVTKIGSTIGGLWDKVFGNDKEKERKEKEAREAEAKKKAVALDPELEAALDSPYEMSEEEQRQSAQFQNYDFEAVKEQQKNERKSGKKSGRKKKASAPTPSYGDNPDDYAAMQVYSGGGPGGVNVSVAINISQNGIPDQTFAQGVISALKSRQSEFEQLVSNIVNQQARLAYGG